MNPVVLVERLILESYTKTVKVSSLKLNKPNLLVKGESANAVSPSRRRKRRNHSNLPYYRECSDDENKKNPTTKVKKEVKSPRKSKASANIKLKTTDKSNDTSKVESVTAVYIVEKNANNETTKNASPKKIRPNKWPKRFQCTDCPKKFTQDFKLRFHAQTHMTSFICTACTVDCKTLNDYRDHLKTNKACRSKIKRKLHKCTICDREFRLKEHLKYHIICHTGEKPFECDYCNKSFRTKYQIRLHFHQHTGLTPFKCEICGRGFSTRGHVNQHMLSHRDEKPFQCDVCLQYYKSAGRLYNHKKIHAEDPFKCIHCGKGFKVLGNLKNHEVRHTGGNERFACTECPKVFIFKHKLRYHMRTHTGERPYACTDCNARFADVSNLQKHFRIHTGIKPYKCSVCEKQFNQLSSLNSHKKSHLTYKPIKCQYCSKDFAFEVDLTLHMRTHGEKAMFKCTVCDKEYEQLCHMKSHRRLHYGNDIKNEERNIPLDDWSILMRRKREAIIKHRGPAATASIPVYNPPATVDLSDDTNEFKPNLFKEEYSQPEDHQTEHQRITTGQHFEMPVHQNPNHQMGQPPNIPSNPAHGYLDLSTKPTQNYEGLWSLPTYTGASYLGQNQ